jgi:hypothetical protein
MNENSAQPAEGKGHWWFVWIMTTVNLPGITFGLLAKQTSTSEVLWGVIALVILALHIVSSVKLGKGGSGWLTAGLIFGGWVLMGASFFVGCLVVVSTNG